MARNGLNECHACATSSFLQPHPALGKFTLTAALWVLSDRGLQRQYPTAFENIDKAPEERERGITISVSFRLMPRIASPYARRVFDATQPIADYVKAQSPGAAQMDAALSRILSLLHGSGPAWTPADPALLARQVSSSSSSS